MEEMRNAVLYKKLEAQLADQDYVAARNKLIPRAQLLTEEVIGRKEDCLTDFEKDVWKRQFAGIFLQKMDMLAKQAGLVT